VVFLPQKDGSDLTAYIHSMLPLADNLPVCIVPRDVLDALYAKALELQAINMANPHFAFAS